MVYHDLETHQRQMTDILLALGVGRTHAERTAEILAWADMRGLESHGIAMVTEYAARIEAGRTNPAAEPEIVNETPVSALVDGNGGLGHPPAYFATKLAMEKAALSGVGIVSVRNSGHFGALGYYTTMAAESDLVAMMATRVTGVKVPPTGGGEARFGTDPWSFAAPGEDGLPFCLDMATTTVAAGRVRNKMVEGMPIPLGWALNAAGEPTTNPADPISGGGFLTPLGGTAESGSYKGYGLAVMVNILSSALSGSTLITDPMHTKQLKGMDTAHFILVFDPAMFRPVADFRADVKALCNALRATPAIDPAKPVMVAGDPERRLLAERQVSGLKIPPGLLRRLHDLARRTNAPWHLEPLSDERA